MSHLKVGDRVTISKELCSYHFRGGKETIKGTIVIADRTPDGIPYWIAKADEKCSLQPSESTWYSCEVYIVPAHLLNGKVKVIPKRKNNLLV